jgi:hypothetical protein
MLKLDVKLDTKEIDKYFKHISSHRNIHNAVKVALARVGIEIRRKSIEKTPRGLGELVNSWKVESDGLSIEAGFDIVYAMYQHQGMRQDGTHIIINRPAGGETYFLKNAIDENYKDLLQIFANTLKKELIKP